MTKTVCMYGFRTFMIKGKWGKWAYVQQGYYYGCVWNADTTTFTEIPVQTIHLQHKEKKIWYRNIQGL